MHGAGQQHRNLCSACKVVAEPPTHLEGRNVCDCVDDLRQQGEAQVSERPWLHTQIAPSPPIAVPVCRQAFVISIPHAHPPLCRHATAPPIQTRRSCGRLPPRPPRQRHCQPAPPLASRAAGRSTAGHPALPRVQPARPAGRAAAPPCGSPGVMWVCESACMGTVSKDWITWEACVWPCGLRFPRLPARLRRSAPCRAGSPTGVVMRPFQALSCAPAACPPPRAPPPSAPCSPPWPPPPAPGVDCVRAKVHTRRVSGSER